MKYYYTDPLKAAWMAREFGLTYKPRFFKKTITLRECHGKHNSGKVVPYMESRKMTYKSILRDVASDIERLYEIENYDALKPRQDDVVEFDGIIHGIVINVDYVEGEVGVQCDDVVYIQDIEACTVIMRDEKPFFTPEADNG